MKDSFNLSRYTTSVTVLWTKNEGPNTFFIEHLTVSCSFNHSMLAVSPMNSNCISFNMTGQIECGFVSKNTSDDKILVVLKFLKNANRLLCLGFLHVVTVGVSKFYFSNQ